jgi:hypothetical protein
MAEPDKFIRVVAKLNELTQEGKIHWTVVPHPEALDLGRDKPVTVVYEAPYKDKCLRIYREEYKYWYDENRYTWSDRIVLAFTEKNGQNAWEFPDVPGLADLFDSVRYQKAEVDKFIREVFSE